MGRFDFGARLALVICAAVLVGAVAAAGLTCLAERAHATQGEGWVDLGPLLERSEQGAVQ